ncbi:hypothetical protein [Streptomyces sp. HNM0574]|uniref:hypothetical protein n=1 Tax=Streptomyces sp. HNM0574 TaxID=2714954 RepID=UPI00146D38AA|nr:hypothetical protein [Streptomyces sp. HNM0574]NLU70902.1 hypothetical protein [Streptomyces sp. HNM0574]
MKSTRTRRTAGRTARLAFTTAAVAGLALAAPAGAGAQDAAPKAAGPSASFSKPVEVWAANAPLRVEPRLNAHSPASFGPGTLEGHCQKKGDMVDQPGRGKSDWWTYANLPQGSDTLFISNVDLVGGEKIEGIPDC